MVLRGREGGRELDNSSVLKPKRLEFALSKALKHAFKLTQKYLFYISQNYSFEILRPIQSAILAARGECAWFVEGNEVDTHYFSSNETRLTSIEEIVAYAPMAVFVPGNVVPNFIPGIKVQVFHGLEYKKKGHFGIRGFFDLYCTQGGHTTRRFEELASRHQHFSVVETGWSKLDPLFTTTPYELETNLPIILFAPTFSPNLTCALTCLEAIKHEVGKREHCWLAKFHPKMNPEWIQLYQEIKADNFRIVETDSCLPLLQCADILLSDTSSMVGEFSLLGKPVITYKNSDPGDYLIDIDSPNKLADAIQRALSNDVQLLNRIRSNNEKLHPYTDGKSSERILRAVDQYLLENKRPPKNKPMNILRTLKLRKKLNYWKW